MEPLLPRHFSPHRFVRWAVGSFLVGGGILILSGDWSSPYLWGFGIGCSAVFLYANLSALDDDLARERFRPPSGGADAKALMLIRISALALLLLAPLDSGRLHWSWSVPPVLRIIGIAGSVGAFTLIVRAMITNRFFSAVLRIQNDRGHHVVDQGPYGVVRHPGYLGMVVFAPAAALALGSWWALIPAAAYCALIGRRVVVEDRYLSVSLPGYDGYTQRVRHRLFPGVW